MFLLMSLSVYVLFLQPKVAHYYEIRNFEKPENPRKSPEIPENPRKSSEIPENPRKYQKFTESFMDFVFLTPTWSDSKRSYLEIDASSGANSFEIEKLRLSAFQNGAFRQISTSKRPLKVDFETTSWLDHFVVGRLRRRVCGTRPNRASPAHAHDEVVNPRSDFEIDI